MIVWNDDYCAYWSTYLVMTCNYMNNKKSIESLIQEVFIIIMLLIMYSSLCYVNTDSFFKSVLYKQIHTCHYIKFFYVQTLV